MARLFLHGINAYKVGLFEEPGDLLTPVEDWSEVFSDAQSLAFAGCITPSEFRSFVFDFIDEAQRMGVITELQIEQIEEQREFFLASIDHGDYQTIATGYEVARAMDSPLFCI